MKPATLDALLIDRELGEVSPAVAELLDAYLASDPAGARRAAELRSTIGLARQATALPPAAAPGPLDLLRLQRAHEAAAASSRRREFYRLAACLALGAGLGWLLRPLPAPSPVTDATAPMIARPAIPPASEPRSNFWSVARLAEGRLSSRATANPFTPQRVRP